MKKNELKRYAKAIVRIGANVRKEQEVFLYIEVALEEFAAAIVDECYRVGAKKVTIIWSSQMIDRLVYQKESLESLSTVRSFIEERSKYMVNVLPARIVILSDDPDGLAGVDSDKIMKVKQATQKVLKKYRDAIDEKHQWTIAAFPTKKWAKKVFPNDSEAVAYRKLGDLILYTSRITKNPIKAWKEHNMSLKEKAQKLDDLKIDYLHYSNSKGTDFKVWLIKDSHFIAGSEKTVGSNIIYNPNMPTEECFITPMKGRAEGRVYSSKPLSYNGQIIDDFYLDFEDGKVVNVYAKIGQNSLEALVNTDNGARMLGEVALVPYNSPISLSNVLFYETLFDENAACHLALGAGFASSINDFEKYTFEELKEMGMNDSIVHVDFMIGTKDLKIVAHTRDNKEVPIFVNGNYAI